LTEEFIDNLPKEKFIWTLSTKKYQPAIFHMRPDPRFFALAQLVSIELNTDARDSKVIDWDLVASLTQQLIWEKERESLKSNFDDVLSVDDIINSQNGACLEFACISATALYSLGYEPELVNILLDYKGGMLGHTAVRFNINGKYMYYDINNCIFAPFSLYSKRLIKDMREASLMPNDKEYSVGVTHFLTPEVDQAFVDWIKSMSYREYGKFIAEYLNSKAEENVEYFVNHPELVAEGDETFDAILDSIQIVYCLFDEE